MDYIKSKARKKLREKTGITKEALAMENEAGEKVQEFINSFETREELNQYTKNYIDNIVKECEEI